MNYERYQKGSFAQRRSKAHSNNAQNGGKTNNQQAGILIGLPSVSTSKHQNGGPNKDLIMSREFSPGNNFGLMQSKKINNLKLFPDDPHNSPVNNNNGTLLQGPGLPKL